MNNRENAAIAMKYKLIYDRKILKLLNNLTQPGCAAAGLHNQNVDPWLGFEVR